MDDAHNGDNSNKNGDGGGSSDAFHYEDLVHVCRSGTLEELEEMLRQHPRLPVPSIDDRTVTTAMYECVSAHRWPLVQHLLATHGGDVDHLLMYAAAYDDVVALEWLYRPNTADRVDDWVLPVMVFTSCYVELDYDPRHVDVRMRDDAALWIATCLNAHDAVRWLKNKKHVL